MNPVKHIPNIITSMNLLCGVMGVIFTMADRLDTAFLCMLAAAVFDFCDGLAARLLKAYSDIGKELDSLCDVVSFGVLPALMLFKLYTPDSATAFFGQPVWRIALSFFPLLIAVFSALRLAKFNLDERQQDAFLGLPTPAAAMICGSLACFVARSPESFLAAWSAGPVFIPLLSLCICALLVSEIPMFAMKFGGGEQADFKTAAQRIAFLALVVLAVIFVALLRLDGSLVFLLSFTAYVVMNLLFLFAPSDKSRA